MCNLFHRGVVLAPWHGLNLKIKTTKPCKLDTLRDYYSESVVFLSDWDKVVGSPTTQSELLHLLYTFNVFKLLL